MFSFFTRGLLIAARFITLPVGLFYLKKSIEKTFEDYWNNLLQKRNCKTFLSRLHCARLASEQANRELLVRFIDLKNKLQNKELNSQAQSTIAIEIIQIWNKPEFIEYQKIIAQIEEKENKLQQIIADSEEIERKISFKNAWRSGEVCFWSATNLLLLYGDVDDFNLDAVGAASCLCAVSSEILFVVHDCKTMQVEHAKETLNFKTKSKEEESDLNSEPSLGLELLFSPELEKEL